MAAQSEPVLAIILSPSRVTAAELYFIADELHVSALGDIQPPENAFDGGQIANGESLGRVIASFMNEKQVTARNAVMVLPEATAITQLIKLPAMPYEDMLGAVRAVAERYAVFAEHSTSVDGAVVEEFEEDGNDMSNVLLAASREANVQQCQECARVAGLELLSVEAVPPAVARAYRERLGGSEVVAVAVIGEVKTDVMILDGGVLRFCYSANAGLPEETERGEWISPVPESQDPFSMPPQLYSELTHCTRFFQNQFPQKAVQRVIIAADHPKAELIASHLAEQLQLPVELGRPPHELNLPTEVDHGAAAVSRALTLAILHGAAISATRNEQEVAFPINLLPRTSAMWRPARPYVKAAVALMALALLVSLGWSFSLNNRIAMSEKKLTSTNTAIARLEPELEALREAKATEIALRTEVERQTARIAKERAVRWSQILVAVSERLPNDMWLTRLASPDSSKLTLTGVSTNRETIPTAIDALSGSSYLDGVVLGSLAKDDTYAPGRVVIRHQINARLLRGLLPPEPAAAPSGASAKRAGEPGEAAASESEEADHES
jgi:Tfp pilus assembly PilM family ATPase